MFSGILKGFRRDTGPKIRIYKTFYYDTSHDSSTMAQKCAPN